MPLNKDVWRLKINSFLNVLFAMQNYLKSFIYINIIPSPDAKKADQFLKFDMSYPHKKQFSNVPLLLSILLTPPS